jgi:hypothetical protein
VHVKTAEVIQVLLFVTNCPKLVSDLQSALAAIVTWPCFRPLLGTAAPAAAEQNQQNIVGVNN